MFGWDFQNRKSDRIKLFLFLLVLFLIVAFTVSAFYRSMNEENAVAVQQLEGVKSRVVMILLLYRMIKNC